VVSKNQKWLEDLEPFVNRFMSFTPIDSTENVPGSIASELHQLPPVDDQTDLSLSLYSTGLPSGILIDIAENDPRCILRIY